MAGKSRIQAGSCFRQSSNEASNHVFTALRKQKTTCDHIWLWWTEIVMHRKRTERACCIDTYFASAFAPTSRRHSRMRKIRLKVPQRLFTDIFGIPQKQRMDNVILSFPRVPTHFTVGNRLVKKRETGVKMSRFLHPRPSHWEEKSRKSALLAPLLDGKTVSWPTLLVFPKSLGITRAQRIPHESSLRLCTYVDMRLVLKRKVE
jgi:hypothetical protein